MCSSYSFWIELRLNISIESPWIYTRLDKFGSTRDRSQANGWKQREPGLLPGGYLFRPPWPAFSTLVRRTRFSNMVLKIRHCLYSKREFLKALDTTNLNFMCFFPLLSPFAFISDFKSKRHPVITFNTIYQKKKKKKKQQQQKFEVKQAATRAFEHMAQERCYLL